MSGAESASTNFVVDGNVRDNAFNGINLETPNKIGAVVGYPGPNNGFEAAAGNHGPEIVMRGGTSRVPATGPDYHAFVDSKDLRDGVYAYNYAPVVAENNNRSVKQSGGKRRRSSKYSNKVKKYYGMKSKRHGVKSKRHGVKKRKTMKKKGMLTNLKNMLRMKGGSPANFTPDPSVPSDRQYMNNQELTNSYTQGGKLAPHLNALANPTLTTPTNNC